MSNNDSTSSYRVEVPDTYVDVKGTGFHLDAGHLVIEGGDDYVAAFAPGQWLAVEKVDTEPDAHRNINTLGGLR